MLFVSNEPHSTIVPAQFFHHRPRLNTSANMRFPGIIKRHSSWWAQIEVQFRISGSASVACRIRGVSRSIHSYLGTEWELCSQLPIAAELKLDGYLRAPVLYKPCSIPCPRRDLIKTKGSCLLIWCMEALHWQCVAGKIWFEGLVFDASALRLFRVTASSTVQSDNLVAGRKVRVFAPDRFNCDCLYY